jgi:CheY-like chemotaxis protein
LETKVSNGIIFIEIAGGMNIDKMAMLKGKISELIQLHKMQNPKVIVIMSALNLSFVDGCNLETLITNVIANSHIRPKMVKFVSTDPFTRKFVAGHPEFSDLEIVPSLDRVIFGMVTQPIESYNPQDLIMETMMNGQSVDEGLFQLRFFSETGKKPTAQAEIPKAKIAIVDNDITSRLAIAQAFKTVKMEPEMFDNGSMFLNAVGQKVYDAIILDINLPDISGFDILATLKEIAYSATIIVYSAVSQKEVVIQALGLGAKSYLVKPLQPLQVVKKTVELINIQHL